VQTDHILTFGLPMNKEMNYTSDQIVGYYQQILRSIASTTGVESASGSTGLPLQGAGFGMAFTISGQKDFADRSQRPNAGFGMVTPDYFKTFGIRLVKGRFLTENDNAASLHVAVVNEQLVRHYFPGTDPIGRTINVEQLLPGVQKLGPEQPWVIVGVYHDVRGGGFERQREEILVPFYQSSWPFVAIAVRTALDPQAMTKTIAKAVHSVDPSVALAEVRTLEQIRDEDLSGNRFALVLFVSFALIALVLAGIGIYGVMAFAVGQREHEIGLRMALGASRDRVVAMVLREGAILALIGMVLGLGGAYFVGRAMKSTLYNVGSIDLAAFFAVSAILLVAALIACYVPARRAAGLDPMRALRTE
jgi:predicted permease